MTDRRLTPANGRVAAQYLRGIVPADAYVTGRPHRIAQPVVDLCATPGGKRERQFLLGAGITVFEVLSGWAFVQADADGYVGYVPQTVIGPDDPPTHFVGTAGTHAYESESFKSADVMSLSFGAQVKVVDERHKMFETTVGYIPKKHLRPLDRSFSDPVTVAQLFFGTPYLWGGNSRLGIDCSGLIQAALQACAIHCPGDSDMQMADVGAAIPADTDLSRGDLIFWKGHVGMMVDSEVMIHANAHHMAVAYEPIADAMIRIKAQGDGDVTARKRLT